VRIDVAFTPAEEASARVGIVVDVIRATSSIAQALASGYERVLCCAEIEDARRCGSSSATRPLSVESATQSSSKASMSAPRPVSSRRSRGRRR